MWIPGHIRWASTPIESFPGRLSLTLQRMDDGFFETAQEFSARGEPFAVATVIEIEGSGSAKPGSKVLIDANGHLVLGWVGGGCVESTVCREASQSIKDGKTKVISLDLTDEILGLGMPCGGTMKIYIEPVLPKPELVIAGHGKIAETMAQLGHVLGFSVTVADPAATQEAFPTADHVLTTGFASPEIQIRPNAYVVVATHHKGDHLSIKKAIASQAAYIALVASKIRAQVVFDYLEAAGVPAEDVAHGKLRTPAGLDIGAQTPEEIALSVIAEVVAVRRGGSGQPMVEVKGLQVRQPEAHPGAPLGDEDRCVVGES
jgi:xanthine dehydrogenase accessory factor